MAGLAGPSAGVMHSVSGLREISWQQGSHMIFSPRSESRSCSAMATVVTARRSVEDTTTVGVVELPLSKRRSFCCWASPRKSSFAR